MARSTTAGVSARAEGGDSFIITAQVVIRRAMMSLGTTKTSIATVFWPRRLHRLHRRHRHHRRHRRHRRHPRHRRRLRSCWTAWIARSLKRTRLQVCTLTLGALTVCASRVRMAKRWESETSLHLRRRLAQPRSAVWIRRAMRWQGGALTA